MFRFIGFSVLLLTTTFPLHAGQSAEECGVEAKSCLHYGAKIFQDRCSLCHGSDGMGEGILPLSMKDYPSTNLMEPKLANDKEAIRRVVLHGGSIPEVSAEMPPWGDELTYAQVESVVDFVAFMRNDLESALEYLKAAAADMQPTLKVGRAVFKGRCSLCHGEYGLGDGKMARIIRNPPPFNLTKSRAPDSYLNDIIRKGGGGVGRSPRMPPFGGDLSESEIKSVILYLKTLRY